MSAEKTGKKYQNYTIISIYLTIYNYTFLFLNSLHVFLLWSENYNFLVYDFCLPGLPFISPFRSCENWGSENDLLRGVLLVNSRARNSNLGRADSEPWAESGPGVKVWLGLGALFWAPGSLLPAPSAGVSLGLPTSGLGQQGCLIFLLSSVRTVSYLSWSQGQATKGSHSFYFLSREAA